jgi:hypothetical protein
MGGPARECMPHEPPGRGPRLESHDPPGTGRVVSVVMEARRDAGLPGQAVVAAVGWAKLETWASSGSITPKTFWSVRRWTQAPQLSK